MVHYKLYLLCRVTAKVRADDKLEPENFRGEGGPQNSKRKKKRCLNFTENEFEVKDISIACVHPFLVFVDLGRLFSLLLRVR